MKVGIVSIYPPPGSKHAKLGGVASYTKNLVCSLSNNCEVAVFAERMPDTDRMYHDESAMVYRCWNKGVKYPFQVFKKLLNIERDIVHVQHEVYLYGGLGSAIVFPLLLFFIRLLRKPVVVTIHGVVPLAQVDRVFLEENGINGSPLVMKVGLILLLELIVFLSTSIIVPEEKFQEVLRSEYNCPVHKICVIHHGIEEKNDLVEKDKAKEELGLIGKNIILFFGYISGYKNVELLIESATFLKTSDWVMVIAGGLHPRLRGDPNYRKYFSDLREKALSISKDRILFRGFISEEEIPLYFSAADLMVFPYKVCMHASGPVSLAISYEKLFLISDSFKETAALEDAMFRNTPRDLARKIDEFFGDAKFQLRSLKHFQKLKKEYSWNKIALSFCEIYREIART